VISVQKSVAKTSGRLPQIDQGVNEHAMRQTPLHPVLELQQTIGNQAVLQLFRSGAIQAKLTINQPGDPYEQEADRIANQVLAVPAPPAVSGAPPSIQRLSGQSNGQMHAAPASVDHALASPGKPLEPALRQDMEQRFGQDFSRVRVHFDGVAEQSARDVNANAYTAGDNIVFGAGRYAPASPNGRRLIAHELTHVVQQSAAPGIRIGQSSDKHSLSPSSNRIQREVGETADEARLRKAQESGANWAKGGNPINPSAESSHFRTDERQAYIRGYIDCARRNNLTKQYEEARKAYPWADKPTSDVPQAVRDWSKPPAADSPRRVEPDPETKEEKSKRSDEVDVDIEELPGSPTVSTKALDPRSNSDYVERRCTAVGYGIYVGVATVPGGGYLLYCNGIELPVLLPAAYVNFSIARAVPVGTTIHNSREDAIKQVPNAPPAPGQPQSYSFYRSTGGLIVPTVFSPGTTPRLVELIVESIRRLGKEVSDELTVVAITIVGARAVPIVVRGLVKVGDSALGKALKSPPKSASPGPPKPAGGEPPPPTAKAPAKVEAQPPPKPATTTKAPPTGAPKGESQPKPATTAEASPTGAPKAQSQPKPATEAPPTGAPKAEASESEPAKTEPSGAEKPKVERPKGDKPGATAEAEKPPAQTTTSKVARDDPQRGVKESLEKLKQEIQVDQAHLNGTGEKRLEAQKKAFGLRQKKDSTPPNDPNRPKVVEEWEKAIKESEELEAQYENGRKYNDKLRKDASKLEEALKAKTYERPAKQWAGVRDEVWANALKEGKGKVLSPSNTEIKPGDPWVMGHKPKYESWKHQESAARRGISREQYIKEYNEANQYRPETKQDNDSHFYEDKTDAYLGK
jgi:hypothetical protein